MPWLDNYQRWENWKILSFENSVEGSGGIIDYQSDSQMCQAKNKDECIMNRLFKMCGKTRRDKNEYLVKFAKEETLPFDFLPIVGDLAVLA